MGERVAALFSILHQRAGGRQAAVFLAAVSDLHGFDEPGGGFAGKEVVEWGFVEEAFESAARKLGGLEKGVVTVEAALGLVCNLPAPAHAFGPMVHGWRFELSLVEGPGFGGGKGFIMMNSATVLWM